MKFKTIIPFLLMFCFFANGQYKIEGHFTPADEKLTWVILYQIKDGKQVYIKNGKIENNQFHFELPNVAEAGTYRVVYKLKDGFVDFLFNKENVKFSFDPAFALETSFFEESDENKWYQNYLIDITSKQMSVDSIQANYFQTSAKNAEKHYSKALIALRKVQNEYETATKNKLAFHFIKATERYNSEKLVQSPQDYVSDIKANFFKNIDFNDPVLLNSSFINDRIVDYILNINISKDEAIQKELYTTAIANVLKKADSDLKERSLIEIIIEEFVKRENVAIVHHLFDNYYDKLPKELQQKGYKKEILSKILVTVGSVAPEIEWTEKGKDYKLSTLNSHKYYIVVFWSSTCSHCEKQLPELYSFLKDRNDIGVVAYALEEKSKTWESLIPNLAGWHHVLGLDKWENKIARTYEVYGTPSYFVLNANKVILAKPNNFIELSKVIKKLN